LKKRGSPRLVLWIMILILLIGVAYVYFTSDNELEQPPKSVSQISIMNDFRTMDIDAPSEPVLGGKFFATEILFPADFKGQVGEEFYVRMEDGHVAITATYRIEELTDDTPAQATYEPLQEYDADYDPEGDYTTKSLIEWSSIGNDED